jgi:arylsulfatase A-like enzyme
VWNNTCNDQALSRGLQEGVRLWSEDLAEAGYELHFTGKWHVSIEESPKDRGWKEHSVGGAAGAHHGRTWEQYRRKAREEEPTERGEGEILRPGYGTYRLYGTRPDGEQSHDETLAAEAQEILAGLSEAAGPWCLYVGLSGPHDPYVVPRRYVELYDLAEVRLPESYADTMEDKPAIYRRMRQMRFGQLGEREAREGVRHYWAYCTYLDELFGRILQSLEATGQAEDTLVLYCSDHADYCGDHGLWAKGIPCFRGAYQVPAVVRWPGGVKDPGRRVDEFISTADFAPTFLELAGVQTDRYFTGASLAPFLRGEEPPEWRDGIHTQCDGVELYYTQRSVTTREFKYVFNGFDWDELYDLREDPDEMVNLAADPAYEEVKRAMCRRMWRFACREEDSAINPYITVSLAPYGPAEAFRGEDGAGR